jgi:hypothetical protein
LKAIKDAEQELFNQLMERYGKFEAEKEWAEIQKIKQRQIREEQEGKDEYGRDLKKLQQLKLMCFLIAFMVVTIYYIAKGHL